MMLISWLASLTLGRDSIWNVWKRVKKRHPWTEVFGNETGQTLQQRQNLPTNMTESNSTSELLVERANYIRSQCDSVYYEQLPADFGSKCRHYQGYDSFMISPSLMLSVPNKCASQYLNQLAFALFGLDEDDFRPGTSIYSQQKWAKLLTVTLWPDFGILDWI